VPAFLIMSNSTILLPFFGVMLLTLVVWVYMYVRRTSYLLRERIDLRKVDTPEKAAAVIPGEVSLASHNLKNLFELPVIFYVVCLYLFVSDTVDGIYLAAASWFLAFRIVHSLIHCTYNKVEHRFAAYILAAVALWAMVIRVVLRIFVGLL
jgi:hypothetical protein